MLCTLAVAVSKALVDEEPVWLFLIGPSGGGKTEAIGSSTPSPTGASTKLTRAGLLSWAPGKNGKRVGLLAGSRGSRSSRSPTSLAMARWMGSRQVHLTGTGCSRSSWEKHVCRGIDAHAETQSRTSTN